MDEMTSNNKITIK